MYLLKSIIAGALFGAALFFVPFIFPFLLFFLVIRMLFGFRGYRHRFGYGRGHFGPWSSASQAISIDGNTDGPLPTRHYPVR